MATVDLHAILPRDARPALGMRDPSQMTYRMAQLASHKVTGERQVYVWAADASGLDEFRRDFPDAVERINGNVRGRRDEWFIEMFPGHDDGVKNPHEVFISGVSAVVRQDAERKARRDDAERIERERKAAASQPRVAQTTTAAEPVVATTTDSDGKRNK